MPLFKQKVTADHLGFELVKIVFYKARESDDTKSVLELSSSTGLDALHIYKELLYLTAFSVSFGLTTSPLLSSNPAMREAISKAYVRHLQQMSNDMREKGIANGLDLFYENYKSRLPIYAEAARSLTQDSAPLVTFGNVFATYCGAPKDLLVVSHGVLVFGVMSKEVSKLMTFVADNYRIVEA